MIRTLAKLVSDVAKRSLSYKQLWIRDLYPYRTTTNSGVPVSAEIALTYSAVYAAIRIISESCAQLPLPVYRRLKNGGRVRVPDHPVDRLLNFSFDDQTNSYTGRETLTSFACGWGNGYAVIDFDGKGQPTALHPAHPYNVSVWQETQNGKIYYEVWDQAELRRYSSLPAKRMLHIPALTFDGLTAKAPLTLARESVGLALATEQHGSQFFGNGSRPGGILYHPSHFKDDDARSRFRQSWDAAYGGNNQQATAILEDGLKWESMTIPNEDSQFLETRKFQISEIARWFRVPPHMLADLDKATFSNIEHQSLEFVTYSLMPWLKRWEAEVNRKLLDGRNEGDLYVEHSVQALLRGDVKARAEFYRDMREIGALSVNDILAMENLNPIGEEGDARHVPLNWGVLGTEAGSGNEPEDLPSVSGSIVGTKKEDDPVEDEEAPQDEEQEEEEEVEEEEPDQTEEEEEEEEEEDTRARVLRSFRPLLIDVINKCVSKERIAIRRVMKKSKTPQELKDGILAFYETHSKQVSETIGKLVGAIADCIGEDVDADSVIKRHLDTSINLAVSRCSDKAMLDSMLKAWADRPISQADRELGYMGLVNHEEQS